MDLIGESSVRPRRCGAGASFLLFVVSLLRRWDDVIEGRGDTSIQVTINVLATGSCRTTWVQRSAPKVSAPGTSLRTLVYSPRRRTPRPFRRLGRRLHVRGRGRARSSSTGNGT